MNITNIETKTAMFAGGCFWCVEADFVKLKGIIEAVSGYAGGAEANPNYENYTQGGYREVVKVVYDPKKTSYRDLVEHIIVYGDPTDGLGSFGDRGLEYAPAIYYDNDEEKNIAEAVVKEIEGKGIYEKPLAILVLSRVQFWPAEDYHQDYYIKNPVRYNFYRFSSGRDSFVEKYKEKALSAGFLQNDKYPVNAPENLNFSGYQKPSPEILKKELTAIEYEVSQEEGTEKPFANEYDANKAEGIYVDRVSGEALFSSKDKYDSGTGWPSFVKPIESSSVVLLEDKKFFTVQTEVRSRYADSHLGHVFDDGPEDRGGQRYCLNSAALIFIPKEEMASRGYGDFLSLFE